MHLKYWSTGIVLCLCTSIFAQETFRIRGNVKDAKTLEPIMGASIIGKQNFAVTGKDGSFLIDDLDSVTYSFQVYHLGYISDSISVSTEGQMVKVLLKPSTTILEDVEVYGDNGNEKAKKSPLV